MPPGLLAVLAGGKDLAGGLNSFLLPICCTILTTGAGRFITYIRTVVGIIGSGVNTVDCSGRCAGTVLLSLPAASTLPLPSKPRAIAHRYDLLHVRCLFIIKSEPR